MLSLVTSPLSVMRPGVKLDIGFRGVDLWRIAEAEYAALVLPGNGGSDRAQRCSDDRRRIARE